MTRSNWIMQHAEEDQWWMADVIHVDGGARNPKAPSLLQVADVDTGTIQWINADLVIHIFPRVRPPPRCTHQCAWAP